MHQSDVCGVYTPPHLLTSTILQLLQQELCCIHIKKGIANVLVPSHPHHLA